MSRNKHSAAHPRADSVGSGVGSITLAGNGAGIAVSGALDAEGAAPGTKGGDIDVRATGVVQLTATSDLDAAGAVGGGTIVVGRC